MIGAPVPIRITETVVARDRTDLSLGYRDIGTMPSDEPVTVVYLIGIIASDRTEIPVRIGNCQPSSRIVRVGGGAIHHLLDSRLEIGKPRRILGKGHNVHAGSRRLSEYRGRRQPHDGGPSNGRRPSHKRTS